MKAAFADTFYFLALINVRDEAHFHARKASVDLSRGLVTTVWVLTEVGDALSAPNRRPRFLQMLSALYGRQNVLIVPPTQSLFERGLELFSRRPDKSWSLTDCVSFVVMEEHGLRDALTGDTHFEQAGYVALLK